MRRLILFFLGLAMFTAVAASPPLSGFVTRRGTELFLNGKPYRAIGVNIPHLHQCFLGTWRHIPEIYGSPENAKTAMIRAVEQAAKSGFAFIRFFAAPGYPSDIDKLYMPCREAYWRGMDELFALCAKHRIRLIPSLNCVIGACGFAAYFEEPDRAVFDKKSYSCQAQQEYVREFVTRYKDSPVILMWELQNEAMLAADVVGHWEEEKSFEANLPKLWETAQKRPKLYHGGPVMDAFSYRDIVAVYQEQAAFIHTLDPNHLVTSGDAETRPECTSRRETFPDFKYRSDTPEERIANNLNAQPLPLDVFSYHFYGSCDASGKLGDDTSNFMRQIIRASRRNGRPVFIGEIAQNGGFQSSPEQPWLLQWLDEAEQEQVALIALWVWHFPWQKEMTMDETNAPNIIRRCRLFNRRYARP